MGTCTDLAMRDPAGDVRKTTLDSLGLKVGQKFIYCFGSWADMEGL